VKAWAHRPRWDQLKIFLALPRIHEPFPGALPQAVTFRAFGAETQSLHTPSVAGGVSVRVTVTLSTRPTRYRDCAKTQRSDFSLKGCQIVAGGPERSADHRTTIENNSTPGTGVRKQWHPSGVRTMWELLSGGLRNAPTTGYYLTALRAKPTRYRQVVVSSWSHSSQPAVCRLPSAVCCLLAVCFDF
jgi:hypothetical protein